MKTYIHLGMFWGFSMGFAAVASDIARSDFGLGVWICSFIWLVAFALLCAPFLRIAAVATILCFALPWWGAFPAAFGVCSMRWFLLSVTDPERKAHLSANMTRPVLTDLFLSQISNNQTLIKRVRSLVLEGKAALVEEQDCKDLMLIWALGEKERASGITSLTDDFYQEFRRLSLLIEACGVDLKQFRVAISRDEEQTIALL
jgi:hypothetical protein